MEPRDIRTAFLLFPKRNKTIIIIFNEIILANKETIIIIILNEIILTPIVVS